MHIFISIYCKIILLNRCRQWSMDCYHFHSTWSQSRWRVSAVEQDVISRSLTSVDCGLEHVIISTAPGISSVNECGQWSMKCHQFYRTWSQFRWRVSPVEREMLHFCSTLPLFVILLIFPIFFVINYFLTQNMFYIVYCNWSSFNLSVTCGFSGYSGFPRKNKTDRSI